MNIEYIIIKEKNEICSDKGTFIKLLETNSDLSVDNKNIHFKSSKVTYNLLCEESEDGVEIAFHLSINSNNDLEKDLEKDLEDLNEVARGLRKTIKSAGHPFQFNTIWDETSQYYCEKSYPLLNKVENLMRKLIFQFMLKSMGSKWIHQAFPSQLKQKVTESAKKNDAEDIINDSLYHADFIQLIELLFERYTSIQSVNKLFERLESINNLEELESFKDLKPQSNWERYFSELIEFPKLKETWRILYRYRNLVAHNKLINKNDFEEIKRLTNLVEEKLNEALNRLDEIKIPEEEKEDISRFTSGSLKTKDLESDSIVTAIQKKCTKCGKAINVFEEVFNGGLCDNCNNSSIFKIERKCENCGKSIENEAYIGLHGDLCTDCRPFQISSTDIFINTSDKNPPIIEAVNLSCKKCGKTLPIGTIGEICNDCREFDL